LKVLWTIGEGNVRSVQQALEPRRRLAYTTVMTLLERLTKKGGLARRKAGRSFIYTPLVDRDTMRRRAVSELTENLFDGSPLLLMAYIQNGAPPPTGAAGEATEERLDTALL
jgi:predicted transcriptional regulator